MQRFSDFDIQELKLVYRILHRNLMGNIELMDADFLESLQKWLQYRAGQDGVDISIHRQWDAWLDGTFTAEGPGKDGVIPLPVHRGSK